MLQKFKYAISVVTGYTLAAAVIVAAVFENFAFTELMLLFLPAVVLLIVLLVLKKTLVKFPGEIIIAIVVVCEIGIILIGLFEKFLILDEYSITALIYFILCCIFSYKTKNIKRNSSFGIRIRVTLDYEVVWVKTHMFLSTLIAAFLPVQFFLIFFMSGWVRFWLSCLFVLIPIFISVFYASIIGIPYAKEAEEKEKQELNEQKKKEQQGIK